MNGDLHEGDCLCGRVRYRLAGEPRSSDIRHCISCRRAAGAQSVAWLTVASGDFSFVSGEPVEYGSSPEVVGSFCGGCGTSLAYRHEGDADSLDVTTASLDQPEEFPPAYHIWVKDKVGWEGANDGSPQFQRSSSSGSG